MTISEERKVCTGSEKFFKMCDSSEVRTNKQMWEECRDKQRQSPNSAKMTLPCVLQLDFTFHLFVCALAGAGAAVIAMVRTVILNSDWLWSWWMYCVPQNICSHEKRETQYGVNRLAGVCSTDDESPSCSGVVGISSVRFPSLLCHSSCPVLILYLSLAPASRGNVTFKCLSVLVYSCTEWQGVGVCPRNALHLPCWFKS